MSVYWLLQQINSKEVENVKLAANHIFVCIHLLHVLTDHFSNSLSEKTTNDITMKFLQCHFKTTFYRLSLPNCEIYLKIIHVRRKATFMFKRTCIACINTITL